MPSCKVFFFLLASYSGFLLSLFCHSTLVFVCGEGALTATATAAAAAAADHRSFSLIHALAAVVVVCLLLV